MSTGIALGHSLDQAKTGSCERPGRYRSRFCSERLRFSQERLEREARGAGANGPVATARGSAVSGSEDLRKPVGANTETFDRRPAPVSVHNALQSEPGTLAFLVLAPPSGFPTHEMQIKEFSFTVAFIC
jgi:hypothetical protein